MDAHWPGIPEAHELQLAHELLGQGEGLQAKILHRLIGRPLRYSELKPLLEGRSDNNLTVALRRLQEMGLVSRRTDARRKPPVHAYELTPLGVQVILAMESIRPIEERLSLFERALGQRKGAAKQEPAASAYDVIIHPFVTEKTIAALERENKLEFVVRREASAPAIKRAIERIFDAHVQDVTTREVGRQRRAIVKFSSESEARTVLGSLISSGAKKGET